ncbi:MAG TPA: Ig-like domain-containing protein, partial [Pirellulales bacterium]|nr:Ig-like domain-containing protein [Pirellulales bacterium]
MRYETLEARELLAADIVAHNDQYKTFADGAFVALATRSVLVNDSDASGLPLTARLIAPPTHGQLTLRPDGTLTYVPQAGFTGDDSFKYAAADGQVTSNVATAFITVKPRAALQSGGGGSSQSPGGATISPLGSAVGEDGAVLTVGDADAVDAGGTATFSVKLTVPPSENNATQDLDIFTLDGTATGGSGTWPDIGDYMTIPAPSDYFTTGSGEFPVGVQTYYSGPRSDGTKVLTFTLEVDRMASYPTPGTSGNGKINVTGNIPPCECDCGCPGFMPSIDPNSGTLTGNGGGGSHKVFATPSSGRLHFDQAQEPHPIISTDDVLSSTVANATDIKVDYTLGNLVSTIYYSPAGYTAGAQVRFSRQFDAGSLSTGQYGWDITVTEEYANAPPVIRSYDGVTSVRNLDNSPYGKGWAPRNLYHVYFNAGGADLDDGSGNMHYFWLAGGDPGMPTNYTTPPELWGDMTLVGNTDGTFTLTSKTRETWQFDSNGFLMNYSDVLGNTTSYAFNIDGTVATVTDPENRTTAFTYSGGRLASTTDFAGRTTSYSYDSEGRMTFIEPPPPGHGEAASTTALTYDATTGLLSSYTDATGTTSYSYDKWRAVTKVTHPDGTYTLYDAPAEQALVDTSGGVGTTPTDAAPLVYTADVIGSQTDEDGNTSHYVVNQYGLTTSSTDAAGNTTTYEYTGEGRLSYMTQPPLTPGGANLVTQYFFDGNGNLSQEDLPDGTSETWTYDLTWNEVTKYVDPAGRETDYSLDPSNGEVLSMTQVSAAGNRVTSYTYTPAPGPGDPPAGLVATITDPRGIVTAIGYNSHGLPTQIVYAQGTPDQATVSLTYDLNDNPATYTDELGRVTDFTYDDLNRLIQTTLPPPDPNNPSVRPVLSAFFDAAGNKTSATDPLANVTSYSYDFSGKIIQVQQPDPAGGTNHTITRYGYDPAGNLTSITDPMSRITTLGYDADNRPNSVQLPNPVGGGTGGPTSSVVYDALGDVIKSFDFNGAETDYTFDQMGRVLTVTGPAPTVGAARPVTTYTYNADSQVLTKTDAMNHVTSYQYDDFGELVQETLPSTAVLHWSFDADGNEVSYEDGLTHTTTYAFNDRNWKTSETDPLSGTTHYGYDSAGNMTSLQDPAGNSTTYVVDGLNRVIQETNQLGYSRHFSYDLDNNLIQETDRDGRVRDFSYDHLNRQTAEQWMSGTTVLETFSYSYNADSQLTSAANPNSAYAYTYDGEGRTASVDNNGTPNVPDVVLSDQYDANGNRTQLSATI